MKFNASVSLTKPVIISIIALVSMIFTTLGAIATIIQTGYTIDDHSTKPNNTNKNDTSTKVETPNTSKQIDNVSNLLACLGNTGGEQRHIQLFGCLEGVSLPATTTAQQIIDILGTIPRDSTQWHDDLVDLLKNNKITISGQDATRLLSAFGSEQRRSSLIGVLCYIKRPIPDSDKNELLKGIDPMYISYVRQQLEKPTNPPCKN